MIWHVNALHGHLRDVPRYLDPHPRSPSRNAPDKALAMVLIVLLVVAMGMIALIGALAIGKALFDLFVEPLLWSF